MPPDQFVCSGASKMGETGWLHSSLLFPRKWDSQQQLPWCLEVTKSEIKWDIDFEGLGLEFSALRHEAYPQHVFVG